MEVYYKIAGNGNGVPTVVFTTGVYLTDYWGPGLYGVSIVERGICWYDDCYEEIVDCEFIIPLSLFEINDTIKKYGSLL